MSHTPIAMKGSAVAPHREPEVQASAGSKQGRFQGD